MLLGKPKQELEEEEVKITGTVAIVFSNKPWAMPPFLHHFSELKFPNKKQLKLLVLDVSGNQQINDAFDGEKGFFTGIKDTWGEYQYLKFNQKNQVVTEPPASDFPDKESFDRVIYIKQQNVADSMNTILQYRVGDVFLMEDDVICPPNTYNKLRRILDKDVNKDVGAATGITYNRNGKRSKYLPLIWDFLSNTNFPNRTAFMNAHTEMRVVNEVGMRDGISTVGATATGCIMYRSKVLDNFHFHARREDLPGLEGQDIMVSWHITQELKKEIKADWSIKTKHMEPGLNTITMITSLPYGNDYDWPNE
jgi:hypothetical protein|tara:strand:+ start:15219 stop:16142 length:924 start_codon:yes stop_codon:yes gene_type:complete